jgi:hypothetical protein
MVTKPTIGQPGWGEALNAALDEMETTATATYVATLGLSNGTDDAVTINAALQNPLGVRKVVRGLTGQTYKVGSLLTITSKVTLDMTGCAVEYTAAAGNVLQNAAVAATATRDTDIGVIGGNWTRGANSGPTALDLHFFRFRRVDRLVVKPARMVSTGGNKFAVNIGDVTRFRIEDIDFAVTSDGVHVNGLCSNGVIRNITGTTGDDTVAFTGNDYPGYNDTIGDISDVLVENINTTSTTAVLKILAGSGAVVSKITVRRIAGTTSNVSVWIGDDTNQTTTTGGSYSDIDVEDVNVTYGSAGTSIFLNGVTADSVRIGKVKAATYAGRPVIDVARASTIKALTFADVTVVTGAATNWNLLRLNGTGTIETLNVLRPTITGASGVAIPFLLSGATTTRRFLIEGLSCPDLATSQNTVQLNSGAVVRQLVVRGADVRYGDVSASNFLVPLAGSTLSQVSFTGGNYFFQGRCLVSNNTSGSMVHVSINDTYVDAMNRLTNLLAPIEFFLGPGLTCDTLVNAAIFLGTGATVVVRGGPIRTVGTFTLLQRNATQAMRVVGPLLPADVSTLTPSDGDMAFNTNGALLNGTGPAVYNAAAAKWRGLYSMATN